MTVVHPEWTTGRLEVPDWCPVPILQDRTEWERCWRFIRNQNPVSVLEIGSFYGGTLWHWTQLPDVERVVSVDQIVPSADSRYPQVMECRELWPDWMTGIDFHDIVGNSTDPGIVERVAGLAPFDVVFIDGDHTYQGVRADWDNYSPMVRRGGMVVLHDTAGLVDVAKVLGEVQQDGRATITFDEDVQLGLTVVFMP